MNENDKQAFGEWVAKDTSGLEYKPKELSWALLAWEAACKYKDKEQQRDKEKNENSPRI